MYVLSFFAGFMTLFTPCILPLLPLVLISIFKRYNTREIFVLFFSLTLTFTLISALLSIIIFAFPFKDYLRVFAATIIFVMGLVMIDKDLEQLLFGKYYKALAVINYYFKNKINLTKLTKTKSNMVEASITGISFGILWSACAGPILASIIALIAVDTNFLQGIQYLFIYSLGVSTSVLFLNIAFKYGIDKKLKINPNKFAETFEKVAGYLLIFSSIMFLLGIDKIIQTIILRYLPL